MKRIIFLAFLLTGFTAYSQISTPSASPSTKITQDFGLGEITIEYSRPSVKDRAIFSADGLVPTGKLWRLGANQATKITFSDDVTVQGTALEAGSYAVLATPKAKTWDIHFFNHESSSWSSYKDKDPVATVTADVHMMPVSVETFLITTNAHTDNSADLEILWDKANVILKLETEVDAQVMKNISDVMAGPTANQKYQAATYYHKAGKDLNQALTWINEATAGDDPKFWQIRRKALILQDMGKTKDAIAAAKMSMELAMKAGNDDYVKLNKESIAKWSM